MADQSNPFRPHDHSTDAEGRDIAPDSVSTGKQPIRDVRSYGAEGDGSTDDTTAMQSALDDGGIIWIPHSHNFRADGLVASSGVDAIIGTGTIERRDGSTGTDRVLRVTGAGTTVRDITINGRNVDGGGRNEGLSVHAQNCLIENVTSKNTADGGLSNAFYSGGTTRGTVFRDCRAENAGYAGYRVDDAVSIINCKSDEHRVNGVTTNASDATDGMLLIRGGRYETTDVDSQANILIDPGDKTTGNFLKRAVVRDVTIDGTIGSGNGFKIEGGVGSALVEGCEFLATPATDLAEFAEIDGGPLVVRDCSFETGRVDVSDVGDYETDQVIFEDCRFQNRQDNNDSLVISTNAAVKVTNCDFTGMEKAITHNTLKDAPTVVEGCRYDLATGGDGPFPFRIQDANEGIIRWNNSDVKNAITFSTGIAGGFCFGSDDSILVINGAAREEANAETPQNDWPEGTNVSFTDTGDGSGSGEYIRGVDDAWIAL